MAQIGRYRGHPLIVRADAPDALSAGIGPDQIDDIAYVQLPVTAAGADALIPWAEGLPIELRLADPARDFAHLYHYARLLDGHPVRVAVPVGDGMESAVRLAVSLDLAVRLEPCQPPPAMIEPLSRLLDDYLHRPTIGQPVDWFQSLLIGRCHDEPVDLWAIVEEDPAQCRWVDDTGRAHLPGRLRHAMPSAEDPSAFVAQWADRLIASGAECAHCPFFDACRGHFKWPRVDYDCGGIRTLLETLYTAADALRDDLAKADTAALAEQP